LDKTPYFDEFDRSIRSARSEVNRERAIRHFEAAVHACDAWSRALGGSQPLDLKATTLAELAVEEPTPELRRNRWSRALHELHVAVQLAPGNPYVADTFGAVAVDHFQDVLSGIDLHARQHVLRIARHEIDSALEAKPDAHLAAVLLSRRSSIIRHLATEELSATVRSQRLDEAVRCAELAVSKDRSPYALLELAIAEWTAGKLESSDERYADRMRTAEHHLLAAGSEGVLGETASLALARFYRMTFQSAKACAAYPRYAKDIPNVRAVLRESYVLGEAATQLWFADYPEDTTRQHLEDARAMLELALSGGYRTARHVVALAFVTAILDGVTAGSVALAEIRVGAAIEWAKAAKVAMEADVSRLADLGFALGIDQASVWTRLGTFARRFLEDENLAETLYREAVRIDSKDPVALTNLARFLIVFRGAPAHQEARRLLQRAQNFADRRFIWWRAVLAYLDEPREPSLIPSPILLQPKSAFHNLKDIRSEFRRVSAVMDRQQRGYELERLVYEIAKLTVGTAAPPYRLERVGGAISQIDGFFRHGADRYRVECKWRDEEVDHNDVVSFAVRSMSRALADCLSQWRVLPPARWRERASTHATRLSC